jgi:hypothetical protein
LYKQVQDPMQHLGNATMPMLWFSWPEDSHFPLDCQAASSAAAAGPQMMALVPGMGHGHGPAWSRPESYAFAESVLETGKPWCSQTDASTAEGVYRATFESDKLFDEAILVSTTDSGYTGKRKWVETRASLTQNGKTWVAVAESGDLIATSRYMDRSGFANK